MLKKNNERNTKYKIPKILLGLPPKKCLFNIISLMYPAALMDAKQKKPLSTFCKGNTPNHIWIELLSIYLESPLVRVCNLNCSIGKTCMTMKGLDHLDLSLLGNNRRCELESKTWAPTWKLNHFVHSLYILEFLYALCCHSSNSFSWNFPFTLLPPNQSLDISWPSKLDAPFQHVSDTLYHWPTDMEWPLLVFYKSFDRPIMHHPTSMTSFSYPATPSFSKIRFNSQFVTST